MSQFFTSGDQIIGASASVSVLPMNVQYWFLLGLTGLISLQSNRLSRVFSNHTVQKDWQQWPPTPVLLPGKSHGQSLVGCSPGGCKESDMTKRLNFQLSIIKWSNEGCPFKHAYYWARKSKWKHTGPGMQRCSLSPDLADKLLQTFRQGK